MSGAWRESDYNNVEQCSEEYSYGPYDYRCHLSAGHEGPCHIAHNKRATPVLPVTEETL